MDGTRNGSIRLPVHPQEPSSPGHRQCGFGPRTNGAEHGIRFAAASVTNVESTVVAPTFGVPGSFKNALDWTVGSGSLYRKPITCLDVAPPGRGAHVREALDLVLRAHGADVARYSLPVARNDRDAAGEVDSPRVINELRAV